MFQDQCRNCYTDIAISFTDSIYVGRVAYSLLPSLLLCQLNKETLITGQRRLTKQTPLSQHTTHTHIPRDSELIITCVFFNIFGSLPRYQNLNLDICLEQTNELESLIPRIFDIYLYMPSSDVAKNTNTNNEQIRYSTYKLTSPNIVLFFI